MGGALFTTCNIEIYVTTARNASFVAEKNKKKKERKAAKATERSNV